MKKVALTRELERRQRERETFRAFLERQHMAPIPRHLDPVADVLQEAADRSDRGEGSNIVIELGPGFGKSSTVVSWCAWRMQRRPGWRVIYRSYSVRLARHHLRAMRALAQDVGGIDFDRSVRAASEWRTRQGGYALASGLRGGAATGFRADAVVTDDFAAGRAEAESAPLRDGTIDAHKSVSRTRLDKGGVNLVVSTPWHPADLAAHCIDAGYQLVRVPALQDGESIWPEMKPTAELLQIRDELGDRDWQALYLCCPLHSDAQLFRNVELCEPKDIHADIRIAIGVDLAYSTKKTADWSVAVVLGLDVATRIIYVLHVERRQCRAEDFFRVIASLCDEYHVHSVHWHASGPERAIADFARHQNVHIRCETAAADKITRATPFSARWNAGYVRVPRGRPWTDAYVSELTGFAPGSKRDDQVDASASAFFALRDVPDGWNGVLHAPRIRMHEGHEGHLRGGSLEEDIRVGRYLHNPTGYLERVLAQRGAAQHSIRRRHE